MPRSFLLSGRPLLQYSGALTAVCIDGNSIPAGSYPTSGSGWGTSVLGALAPLNGAVAVANVAISGQTFANMTSTHSDVDGAFVGGKTNVLIVWEVINAVYFGRTGAQAFSDLAAYIAAVKAVHPWKIVCVTGTYRYQDPTSSGFTLANLNANIDACNALIVSSGRSIGVDAVADIRQAGSPFNLADSTVQANYIGAGVYNTTTDGSDSHGPIIVHHNDTGFAYTSGVIAAALRRVPR